MGQPLPLRPGYDAPAVRVLARRSKDAGQARRLLALPANYDGRTRSEAARLGNIILQIVRDWVVRFNAKGPDGLRDRKAPGARPRLTDRGTEFCGAHDRHEYELYLGVENIDHTRTRTKSPQTNGICEWFHKTLLEEFYRIAFRRKLYTSIAELQGDVPTFVEKCGRRAAVGHYAACGLWASAGARVPRPTVDRDTPQADGIRGRGMA